MYRDGVTVLETSKFILDPVKCFSQYRSDFLSDGLWAIFFKMNFRNQPFGV